MRNFLCLLLLSFLATAVYSQYVPMTSYGYQMQRFKPVKVLHIPNYIGDTTLQSTDTSAQIRLNDGVLQYHLGYWHNIGSGGGAADRFGIEDNLGVQNRGMDMEGFNSQIHNFSDYLIGEYPDFQFSSAVFNETSPYVVGSGVSAQWDDGHKGVGTYVYNSVAPDGSIGQIYSTLTAKDSLGNTSTFSSWANQFNDGTAKTAGQINYNLNTTFSIAGTDHSVNVHLKAQEDGPAEMDFTKSEGANTLLIQFPSVATYTGINTHYWPVSVDGIFADSTGNIPLAVGSGTLTNFAFTDGNGFDGTVTNPTTTPTLTLTTQLTLGSVPFTGTAGALRQNNPKFFWDSTNARLGIGTTTPRSTEEINGNIYVGDTITTNGDVNHDRVSQYYALITAGDTTTPKFPNAFYSELKTAGAVNFTGGNTTIMAGQSNLKLDANITVQRGAGFLGRAWAIGTDSITTMIGVQGGIDALSGATVRVRDAIGVAGSTFQEGGTIIADSLSYFKTVEVYRPTSGANWTEDVQNKFGLFIHDYYTGGHNDYGIYQAGTTKQNVLDGSLRLKTTPSYTDNAAAITGGLSVGTIYRNGDILQIVH